MNQTQTASSKSLGRCFEPAENCLFPMSRRTVVRLSISLAVLVASLAFGLSSARATTLTAFSDFGPGNTYGNFGNTIGGQFVNGFEFTSAAAGQLAEIDIGIGGAGTFNLTLYTDSAGALGTPIWSTSNVPVGLGSPNPAVINVVSGPALSVSQNYWLVASGPSASAYWSPNTIGAQGTQYHHDSGSDFYAAHSVLGAFAVKVVPEPATFGLLCGGLIGLACFAGLSKRRHRART
jgi:hypothetical protein